MMLSLLFVGTADRIKARVVPEAGERFEAIEVSGIVGLRGWRKVLGLVRLPMALFQAMGIIRRFQPDVVVGAGGFLRAGRPCWQRGSFECPQRF